MKQHNGTEMADITVVMWKHPGDAPGAATRMGATTRAQGRNVAKRDE